METIDEPSPDDQATQVPAVVQPATLTVKARFPQATIAVQPNLWHNWARIAMRAEARAIASRREALTSSEDIAQFIETETLESMVVVLGVRQSFHHLYLEWRDDLGIDAEHHVAKLATTDLPLTDDDLDAWLADVKSVIDDRNEIIHDTPESLPVVPHPLGTNTSVFDARFTLERATRAVDLMLDFYQRVLLSPSAPLSVWSSKRQHVYDNFVDLRAKYQGQTK
jgi:hypothetical protein